MEQNLAVVNMPPKNNKMTNPFERMLIEMNMKAPVYKTIQTSNQ